MAIRQKLGNAVDWLSSHSAVPIPETRASEWIAGNKTTNTDTPKYYYGANDLNTRNAFNTLMTPGITSFQPNLAQTSTPWQDVETTTTHASFDPFTTDLEDETGGTASGSGGSGTSESYTPEFRTIQGDPTRYDINDPAQAKAYFDKRLAIAAQLQEQGLASLRDTQTAKLAAADRDYADQAATLDDRFNTLGRTEADYARDYDNRVNAFGKGYSTAQAKRQNAFAGTSGFQSAQGDSERLAYGQYEDGLDDLSAEKASNQNAFATKRGALTRQKSGLADAYTTYQSDLAREIGAKETELGNSVNAFKSEASSELAPFDYASGISDYQGRYQLEPYDPVATQTADLSKYGAATSFSGIKGQTGTTPANPFANLGSTQSPLEQYLDVTKEKKQKDPMKQYLYA